MEHDPGRGGFGKSARIPAEMLFAQQGAEGLCFQFLQIS